MNDTVTTEQLKVQRPGKTARDHSSGAWKNRFANQQLRDAWYKDKGKSADAFPNQAARGKGNSSKARKYGAAKRAK